MTRARWDAPDVATDDETQGAGGLAHRVEEYGDREECTVFPRDADADELLTTWMTATDDAFVDLAEMH